jgi:hypothetical protein
MLSVPTLSKTFLIVRGRPYSYLIRHIPSFRKPAAMQPTYLIAREKLYELAEWLVTGMVLVFGLQYIRQIIAFVLMELYRIFIQRASVSIT